MFHTLLTAQQARLEDERRAERERAEAEAREAEEQRKAEEVSADCMLAAILFLHLPVSPSDPGPVAPCACQLSPSPTSGGTITCHIFSVHPTWPSLASSWCVTRLTCQGEDAVRIAFRLFTGERLDRSFRPSDTTQALYDFVETTGKVLYSSCAEVLLMYFLFHQLNHTFSHS